MTNPSAPERYRTAAIPHLMVNGADDAILFYRKAFGAQELFRLAGWDGRIVHSEVSIEGSVFMLGDADGDFAAPPDLGGTSVGLHVYVRDVDAFADTAVAAGAELIQPPTTMFYGDRTVMFKDPFGHIWVFLTHLETLTPQEVERRGAALPQPR